jgi:hypothetical protein
MLHFKNFYVEIKSLHKQHTIREDCWWGQQPQVADVPDEKPSLLSLIRMGDKPSAIVIEPEKEEVGNEGGSIEDTPKNPVISDTNDPAPDSQEQIQMIGLRERWTKMSGLKK